MSSSTVQLRRVLFGRLGEDVVATSYFVRALCDAYRSTSMKVMAIDQGLQHRMLKARSIVAVLTR